MLTYPSTSAIPPTEDLGGTIWVLEDYDVSAQKLVGDEWVAIDCEYVDIEDSYKAYELGADVKDASAVRVLADEQVIWQFPVAE